MEIAGLVAFWLLLAWAFLGIFINKFPSCFLVLLGTLSARFLGKIEFPMWVIAVVAVMWIIAYVLNKNVLPKLMAKLHEYSKGATWGCTIGSVLALLFSVAGANPEAPARTMIILIAGLIILPYLFAFLFELAKVKNAKTALAGAGAAFSLYLATAVVKYAAIYFAFYAVTKLAVKSI